MHQDNRFNTIIANTWSRPEAPLKFSESLGGACDETIITYTCLCVSNHMCTDVCHMCTIVINALDSSAAQCSIQ